jgi:hypothetical protein
MDISERSRVFNYLIAINRVLLIKINQIHTPSFIVRSKEIFLWIMSLESYPNFIPNQYLHRYTTRYMRPRGHPLRNRLWLIPIRKACTNLNLNGVLGTRRSHFNPSQVRNGPCGRPLTPSSAREYEFLHPGTQKLKMLFHAIEKPTSDEMFPTSCEPG